MRASWQRPQPLMQGFAVPHCAVPCRAVQCGAVQAVFPGSPHCHTHKLVCPAPLAGRAGTGGRQGRRGGRGGEHTELANGGGGAARRKRGTRRAARSHDSEDENDTREQASVRRSERRRRVASYSEYVDSGFDWEGSDEGGENGEGEQVQRRRSSRGGAGNRSSSKKYAAGGNGTSRRRQIGDDSVVGRGEQYGRKEAWEDDEEEGPMGEDEIEEGDEGDGGFRGEAEEGDKDDIEEDEREEGMEEDVGEPEDEDDFEEEQDAYFDVRKEQLVGQDVEKEGGGEMAIREPAVGQRSMENSGGAVGDDGGAERDSDEVMKDRRSYPVQGMGEGFMHTNASATIVRH